MLWRWEQYYFTPPPLSDSPLFPGVKTVEDHAVATGEWARPAWTYVDSIRVLPPPLIRQGVEVSAEKVKDPRSPPGSGSVLIGRPARHNRRLTVGPPSADVGPTVSRQFCTLRVTLIWRRCDASVMMRVLGEALPDLRENLGSLFSFRIYFLKNKRGKIPSSKAWFHERALFGFTKWSNSFSAETDFRCHNLTSIVVRFWRLKLIPVLKYLKWPYIDP